MKNNTSTIILKVFLGQFSLIYLYYVFAIYFFGGFCLNI